VILKLKLCEILVSYGRCLLLLINRPHGHDRVTCDDDKQRQSIQEEKAV